MSVARAQREIDAREFAEWRALDSIEPITLARIDYAAALIAYFVAQTQTKSRLKPDKFLSRWWDAVGHGAQTDADMESLTRVISNTLGGGSDGNAPRTGDSDHGSDGGF